MRVPVTSQLALLVLSLASWRAWTEPTAEPRHDAPPEGRFHTLVVAHADVGKTVVSACGEDPIALPAYAPARGERSLGMFTTELPLWGCTVEVTRTDGDYAVTRTLYARGAGTSEVALPEHRVGGIGVSIVRRGDSVWIEGLFPRGAAHEAGLRPGDWLVTADGERLETVGEARERLLGPEGSTVRVEVFREESGEWSRLAFDLERRADVR